ncbi:MAG TPA: copper chaperone PCu(A)C [Caulobacteraceae bacterium]|jgi:hypothetical protein|nr:copper chaperone PCu(A)C [Caulobacteraceae bacterium]
MRQLLAVAAIALLAGQAAAGTIEVRDAWIRSTPPGAPTAAGYATLINHGPATDRLVDGHTSVAASVTPHTMSMAGGVMRMRPVAGGLPIAASATLRLAPSGDHLMLLGLKHPLTAGQHVRVTLNFTRAGPITTDFVVRDAAGM